MNLASFKTSSILLSVALLVGCAADGGPAQDFGQNGGKADAIPTRGLELIASVGDNHPDDAQERLEKLFHSSRIDEDELLSMVIDEMDARDASAIKIKAEGVPVFTDVFSGLDLRLGRGLSRLARSIWTGKIFTFSRDEDGVLTASLENDIFGRELINANVTIRTMRESMENRGEKGHDGQMAKFGLFETPVAVDEAPSVILDYELTSLSLFSGIIDEIRPVSERSLAEAGIDLPADVDVSSLWIGRATALFGIIDKEREFVVYFALDFDANSIQVVE